MGDTNMAAYQFSNFELLEMRNALNLAQVPGDVKYNIICNNIINTINRILAARNTRG